MTRCNKDLTCRLVTFQQPRPGPPIPKGSLYLTVGWTQVGFSVVAILIALFKLLLDLDSPGSVQETSVHLYLPLFLLSSCGCMVHKFSFSFAVLIFHSFAGS